MAKLAKIINQKVLGRIHFANFDPLKNFPIISDPEIKTLTQIVQVFSLKYFSGLLKKIFLLLSQKILKEKLKSKKSN